MGRRAQKIFAPFSPDQVENLRRFQHAKWTGHLTCVMGHVFEPDTEGLICPVDSHHNQGWAWDYMAERGWLDRHFNP